MFQNQRYQYGILAKFVFLPFLFMFEEMFVIIRNDNNVLPRLIKYVSVKSHSKILRNNYIVIICWNVSVTICPLYTQRATSKNLKSYFMLHSRKNSRIVLYVMWWVC